MNPLLDTYFPATLFSRAPEYFSKRAPYLIVPVRGGGEERGIEEEEAANRGSRSAGSEGDLEVILQELFLTGTAIQQAESGASRSPVSLGRLLYFRALVSVP